MQYQVPQFIEVEDQIVGSLTLKQFLYLIGGAGGCFVVYKYVNILIAIPIILAIAGFSAALAFYKVNNRPFIDTVESAVTYYFGNKLYIWKKDVKREIQKENDEQLEIHKLEPALKIPTLSQSKLKELTWSLDVNEKKYKKN